MSRISSTAKLRLSNSAIKVPDPVRLSIDQIRIPITHRAVNKRSVQGLVGSIMAVGLQNPIAVVRDKNGVCILTAGRHRLEAFKQLGRQTIPARILDSTSGEIWKHSENLHRFELTRLERDEAVVEYIEARKKLGRLGSTAGGRQPNDRGNSAVGRELQMDRKQIRESKRRAKKIHSKTKRFLKLNGMDNKVGILNAVAKCPTAGKQIELARRSMRKNTVRYQPNGQVVMNAFVKSALGKLERSWRKLKFRRLFNRASETTRKLFIRRVLRVG